MKNIKKQKKSFQLFLKCVLVFAILGFTGKEDIVELTDFVNGRASANFLKSANNIDAPNLPKGTVGKILEHKKFPKSGNYGLYVEVITPNKKGKKYWVYYNTKNPRMKLYDSKAETKKPEDAVKTETTADVPALVDPKDIEIEEQANKKAVESVTEAQEKVKEIGKTQACTENCIPEKASNVVCDSNNDYVEKELNSKVPVGSFMHTLTQSLPNQTHMIDPRCIQQSLKDYVNHKRFFKKCDANGNATPALKPCLSDKYINLIQNSFDLSAACLRDLVPESKDDDSYKSTVENLYSLMNQESGLHISAVSHTSASGSGQLTSGAIADVNDKRYNELKTFLSQHENPICKKIAQDFLSEKMPAKASVCDRTQVSKGHPMKNLIYSFSFIKVNYGYLQKGIFGRSEFSSRFDLPPQELARLKRSMTLWAHNAGAAGTISPTVALLKTKYSNKKVTNVDQFLKELSESMKTDPHKSNSSQARIKETSQFFNNLSRSMDSVRSKATGGNSCVM